MSTTLAWTVAVLLAVAAVFTLLLLIPPKGASSRPGGEEGGISVSAGDSVVTVRKVGQVTSVLIREGVRDHWEGSDGIVLPPLPVEVTRREEPALYAEYLSPDTSAVRRYEIADDLYARGYTLPWIRGLDEQYRRERREALEGGDPDARTILERTPVDLTGRRDAARTRELDIDQSLRGVRQPDLGETPPGDDPQDND